LRIGTLDPNHGDKHAMREPKTKTEPNIAELLARAQKPAEEALRLHPVYRGKLEVTPKCAIHNERGSDRADPRSVVEISQ
jgi:hypothetical protein